MGLLLTSTAPLFAQEKDPYSDYSHLWEKEGKKKKKKKGKSADLTPVSTPAPILSKDSTDLSSINLSDSVRMDSVSTVSSDSLQNFEVLADSLDTATIPADTTDVSSDNLEAEDPFEEAGDIVPKEKKPAAASNDFRAGMPGSEPKNSINAGVGFTNISGQYHVGLTLSPEFNFGKVGFGLHVPLLYGLDDKKIRTEIFKGGVGPLRLIRYVRYGTQKRDPYYFRLGELDQVMMGFGSLVNNYTNSSSYEKRKFGLHYDLNYRGIVGLEGMYSDFDARSLNLFAIRPYVRPLATTGIPVVSTLEIGTTFIKDKDQTKIPTSDSTSTTYTFTEPGIGAFGIDAGITVVNVPFIQIDLFGGYSKLNVSSQVLRDTVTTFAALLGAADVLTDGFNNGSGISAGVNFRFHFIANVLDVDMRIERLSYKDHYLPQFFDTSYELNKDLRILNLGSAEKQGGIYGSLTGHIIQKVKLGGSLMIPDDISATSPAFVRLHADLERVGDKISLHGSYVKGNLATLKDAFKLDENSLAKVRFIYHMNKYVMAGVDYYWAFALDENGAYKATSFVSPYFGVSFEF